MIWSSESDIVLPTPDYCRPSIQKIQVMGPQNHLYLLLTRDNQAPRGWRTDTACNSKIENQGCKQKSVLYLRIKIHANSLQTQSQNHACDFVFACTDSVNVQVSLSLPRFTCSKKK